MNSLQKLTSWQLSLKSKLCVILHTKRMSKTLSTTTHCCWSVLLLQVWKGQLRHPLKRDVCLGNILPVSHHKEGRQAAEVQGHAAVRSQGQEDLHNPNMLLSISACPFSAWLRESADKWSICVPAHQWQSCPCCLLNFSHHTFPAATRRWTDEQTQGHGCVHALYVAPNAEHKYCLREVTLAGAAVSLVTALLPESVLASCS